MMQDLFGGESLKMKLLKRMNGLLPTIMDMALILVVAGVTYLPLVPWLGYYRDDWHMIWSGSTQGLQGVARLFTIDRPFMGFVYGIEYMVLGDAPIAWNIYAFILRVIGAMGFHWLVGMVWPNQRRLALIMTIIFILYPGFLQQPNANTFQNHLMGFALAIFSIGFSIRAYIHKSGNKRVIFSIIAVFLAIAYLFIYEYMIGLEGARLLMLAYLVRRDKRGQSLHNQWRAWLIGVIPYMVVSAAFLTWRLFFFKSARSVTDVAQLGSTYLSSPFFMTGRLVVESCKDLIETMFLGWVVPFYQFTSQSSLNSMLGSLVVAGIGVLIIGMYLKKSDINPVPPTYNESGHDLIWVGLACSLASLLPVIAANRQVLFSDTFDRYTLQATLGVGFFWGGVYQLAGKRNQTKLLYILTALAMATHYHNAAWFARSWEIQKQTWWQLTWRAPDLMDGTVIIPQLPEGYRLAEGYEAWAPANLIYRPGDASLPITGEVLNSETILKILQQETMGRSMRKLEYKNDFKNSLVLSMPSESSCMHVVNGNQPELPGKEDPLVRLVAFASDPKWINPDGNGKTPPETIFGKEPPHGWCYYYQKADLARQKRNWETVLDLWDEAVEKQLSPFDTVELMPFYEGFVHLRFERVNEIARVIRQDTDFIRSYCSANGDKYTLGDTDETLDEFVVKNLCVKQ